jgi:hypothetical protein
MFWNLQVFLYHAFTLISRLKRYLLKVLETQQKLPYEVRSVGINNFQKSYLHLIVTESMAAYCKQHIKSTNKFHERNFALHDVK